MKKTYQRKLTFSFLLIFILFTIGIVVFEQQRAKKYKTEALEERLDAYAGLIESYLSVPGDTLSLDSLLPLLPREIRVTIIAPDGRVTYDNVFTETAALENHSNRPEIIEAKENGKGTFIRESASNGLPYLYYAEYFGDAYVRVAMPYDIKVQSFLKPDNGFLYFILTLFIVGFLFIQFVGSRFGKSIRELRDFSLAVSENDDVVETPNFPPDELGQIGVQIARDYGKVKESERKLEQEREKLLQHVQASAEGVCFFNPDRTVAFYNGLFLLYLNTLSRNTTSPFKDLFREEAFISVLEFLKNRQGENYFETRIIRHGKEFLVRINVFDDDSFEVILDDITSREKNRRLKQEMTGNIAHELRTPITSIRGFLETILDNELPRDKERSYLERAYAQSKNLSELISDMSLLAKIEQGSGSFARKDVVLSDVIGKVEADFADTLRGKNIMIESLLPKDLIVNGNENLLYSVFRNLTDNAVRHAGENIKIIIKQYDERGGRVYLSFADTGVGIEDEMKLNRLFERFYRITEGRTRETGGSGLGLSIVKNAVLFHGGSITAKNREGGGLEFLFDLEKKR